jgi:hypothetical protein
MDMILTMSWWLLLMRGVVALPLRILTVIDEPMGLYESLCSRASDLGLF